MEKTDIKSLYLEEIKKDFEKYNLPKFRAQQVYGWLHQKGVNNFTDMTNIPKSLIEILQSDYIIKNTQVYKRFPSKIDETVKFLYKLYDGEYTEGVLMKYKYGYSLCVSTQVGCAMGCKFCASTLNGRIRNLSAGEILSQVYAVERSEGVKISHIVLMGMGEPLDNYEQVIRFIRIITDEAGRNISCRNISLSTCGIVTGIKKLMSENLPLTLSVSLHAPTDEIRDTIMPINRKWKVDELLSVCKEYVKKTNRRISFEYSMIRGVNDSEECARILAHKLKGVLCHINLIPINSVEENSFEKSSKSSIKHFCDMLNKMGINATIRRTLGKDIDASCGQLRSRNISKEVDK